MGLRPRWGRCLSGDRTLLQRSEVSLLFLLPQGGEAEAQADGAPRAAQGAQWRPGVDAAADQCVPGAEARTRECLRPAELALGKRREVGEEWTCQQGSQSLVGLRRSTCGRNGRGRTFLPRSGGGPRCLTCSVDV